MKGKITNFKAEKGFGFIQGEDNKNYFFHISSITNPMDIEENFTVDFKVHNKDKGLAAVQITIITPLSSGSKDKILKIKDLRIRASDIKEYEVTKIKQNGNYIDEDGNYHYKVRNFQNIYKHISDSILEYDKDNETKNNDNFISLSNDDIIDNGIGLHSGNTEWLGTPINIHNSEFINLLYFQRDCYILTITTYTSGNKHFEFKSHNDSSNKKEVYLWLDYIDDELEKLL